MKIQDAKQLRRKGAPEHGMEEISLFQMMSRLENGIKGVVTSW